MKRILWTLLPALVVSGCAQLCMGEDEVKEFPSRFSAWRCRQPARWPMASAGGSRPRTRPSEIPPGRRRIGARRDLFRDCVVAFGDAS